MVLKGCKFNGNECPVCGKNHRDRTGANNELQDYWKGKKLSREHRMNVSKGLKGMGKTLIHKKRISESLKGRIPDNINLLLKHRFKQGENHPNWLGGISYEPYGVSFSRQLKECIKERDGCCMLCNLAMEDIKILGRQTHVHHIDYVKRNNLPQNLVMLCNNCHTLTNFNRDRWTQFFHSLLAERYDYKYSLDQKIILDFIEVQK